MPPRPASLLSGQAAPAVTDVWVVFKTHCDIGYTMSAAEVLKKYREPMMDNAIRLIEADRTRPKNERFIWTIAGWPMAEDILGPLQTPERRSKIEQALREGSIAVHALPATLHTDSFDLEDYVRGLEFSSKIARTYGHPLPVAGKMTDVPGHSWITPTLLHHARIKFLQIGANYSNRSLLVPRLFWWEGPDGSRILCHYTPEYGSDLIPPKDWPAKNYLAVIMTHDNEGPPSPEMVAAVRNTMARQKPGVRLHLGSLDDFANAVLAENPPVPVVRGDMVDPWIHGLMSMPVETKAARNIRPLEPALETLDTELRAWGLATTPLAADLAKAYEQSLLYGEHTWGASSPWYGFWNNNIPNHGFLYGAAFQEARAKGLYAKFESSFNDHRVYIRKTEQIVSAGISNRLALLAQSVNSGGKRVVVWNALPWPRSGLVEVDGRLLFADSIPANGYKTFPPPAAAKSPASDATTLETPYYRVTFDLTRGGISSLIEKKSGRELVDKSSPYALGQFIHERFSRVQCFAYYNAFATMNNCHNGTVPLDMPADAAYSVITPRDWQLSVRRENAADIATLTARDPAGLGRAITIAFTFPANQASMDTEWSITEKTADTIPEGGWLCFPFAVEQPRYTAGRLGGPMDLAKDQIVGGNRHLYAVNSGVTITAPDQTGVGLCAMDSPCVSFGEPGLWKYTFDYFPKRPWIFINLHNNKWRTNFPLWTDGSWSSRVRLWPTTDLAVPSWEARVPLLAAAADGPAGHLPKTQTGLSVSRPGVLVTAFGRNPDGGGTILRVWDQSGESGNLTVTLPGKFSAATPVNLRGEKTGDPVRLADGKLTFELHAHAPASYLLN